MANGASGKRYYVIACNKHGKSGADGVRHIKVGPPATRKKRVEGCPQCKRERMKAERLAALK